MKEYLPIKYRSDQRTVGGIAGECIFCNQNRQLRLSHVVPKWMYRPLQEEGAVVGDYPSLGISNYKKQDGPKLYLLCDDCELYFSKSEKYMKQLLECDDESLNEIGVFLKEEDEEKVLYGVDYNSVLRFMLSVVFRTHHATCAPFHNINFTNQEINFVKKALQTEISNDLDFIVVGMFFSSDEESGINAKGMVMTDRSKNRKATLFSLVAYGWEWMVFINGKRKLKDKFILNKRLRINKPYRIMEGNIIQQRFVEHKILKAQIEREERGNS